LKEKLEGPALRLWRRASATLREENLMTQIPEDDAARLVREHEAATTRLAQLREEAEKLGAEFEEKFKPEILEVEVELVRLSALLGKIGL
jgi:hypothetical protein